MSALTRVVQRRCEKADCEWYGVPVVVGVSCPGCGEPLTAKSQIRAWVPLIGVALVLGLASYLFYHLRPPEKRAAVAAKPAPGATPSAASSPAPQAIPPRSSAIQEASQAVSRGERLASRGLYEDARREFLHATLADPASPVAWANLGAASSVTRRVEEARAAYDKALALAPDNWLTHYNLAVLLAREGNRDGAVRHLERFSALIGPREEKRRKAIDDLRNDPALSGLLGDPRLRDLAPPAGGRQ
jgi:tetratricopeptide (TPR) repeat protein